VGIRYIIPFQGLPSVLALFINVVALAFFAGLAVAGFVALASFGEKTESSIIAGMFKWFVNSQMSFMLLAGFLIVYFRFFRPAILINWQYLQLLDWLIVVIIVWGGFSSVRGNINRNLSAQLKYSDWEKHKQKIEIKLDPDLEYAEKVQFLFVEEGVKEELVVYLVDVLLKNVRQSLQSISDLLNPLINYQDEPVPSPSLNWVKNRVIRRNRKNREMLLMELLSNLKQES